MIYLFTETKHPEWALLGIPLRRAPQSRKLNNSSPSVLERLTTEYIHFGHETQTCSALGARGFRIGVDGNLMVGKGV